MAFGHEANTTHPPGPSALAPQRSFTTFIWLERVRT
jgi:hypothetical protein